ncbi:MAG: hypothetical protein IKV54_07375 [Clostridia bacterium]|nr:hypothetical protein [Clostridia bacterium]
MSIFFALSLAVTVMSGSLVSFIFFITAAASGAMVFCLFPVYVWPLPIAAAALVTVFLADSALVAVGMIMPIAVAFVLGWFSRRDKSLSPAVGTATAVMFTIIAALGFVLVYHYEGGISVEAITSFARRCHGFLTRSFSKMLVYKNGETQISILTYEQISNIVRNTIAVLPGYVVCFSFLISYISSWLYRRFLSAFGYASNIIPFFFYFDMSLVSASVFLIASILSFFLGMFPKAEVAYFAAENMRIMLMPAFALLGYKWLKKGFAKLLRGAKFGCLAVLLIPVVLSGAAIGFLAPLLTFFSVAGAVWVVKRKAPRIDFGSKEK